MSMHVASTGAKPAGPCAMVIFGAGGDLTKRLVVPSLYNLACADLLPEQFAIVGFDLADMPAEQWHESLKQMTEKFVEGGGHPEEFKPETWDWLTKRMRYIRGDLNDPASYQKLSELLQDVDQQQQTGGNYLFYLAVADRFFAPVVEHLGESKLAQEANGQWRRVVVEKPFGHDLEFGERSESPTPAGARRNPDLPNRSFSRKGNSPEHYDVPVRQWALRTYLEPRSDRSCADHCGRDRRRRKPGQILRKNRRIAGHGSEPPLSTALHDSHGSAEFISCRGHSI